MLSRRVLIFLVGLLVLVSISHGPRIYAYFFYERTTGTITGMVAKKVGKGKYGSQNKLFSVTSYTINDSTYQVEGPGMNWHGQYVGKPMQVLYNSQKPHHAYLGEPVILFGEPVWWVVFVAFFWWFIAIKAAKPGGGNKTATTVNENSHA